MNDAWITTVSVALIGLGVLAELNLLIALLREGRKVRRGDHESFPDEARTARRSGAQTPARPWVTPPQLAAFVLAPGMVVGTAMAQDAASPKPPATTGSATPPSNAVQVATDQNHPAPATETPKSPYSLQLNLDYTTAYFYHGIIQEDTGFILQPAAKLTVNLHEGDDFKLDAYFTTWNSFQGQKTGAQTHGDFTEYWYESDLIGGISLSSGKFSLAAQYVFLTSPSDAYQTVQELDLTLAYDDADLLRKFALHPYALLAIETGADASDGADSDTGTYLELGITPGFSFDVGTTPVSITFPASIGLSLRDYYQDSAGDDDTFGFAQIGVKASIPLPMADRYGKWILNSGVSAMFLGDHTAEYNGGQRQQLIATVGLQLNF